MIFYELSQEQQERVYQLEYTKKGEYSLKIDRNVDLCNEKYVVIEEIVQIVGVTNKVYSYYYIIMCKECGHIIKINKGQLSTYTSCQQCNFIKHRSDFVGYENIAYKVLDFDHVSNRKLYYKCQCKNCGAILVIRKDNIVGATQRHCTKCVGNGIKPSKEGPLNVYEYVYKEGAASRGFIWELSKENFRNLISKNCYYCGEPPRPIQSLRRYTKVKDPIFVNGIDRMDSNKGYTVDNCVPCCSKCNRMKMDNSCEDFLAHVAKIHKFQESSTTTEIKLGTL